MHRLFTIPLSSQQRRLEVQKERYLPWGLIWEMSAQIQLSAGMDHCDSHSALFLQVMKWILHHILYLETEITVENSTEIWSQY